MRLAIVLHGSLLVVGVAATLMLSLIVFDQETKAAFPFHLGDWAAMGIR